MTVSALLVSEDWAAHAVRSSRRVQRDTSQASQSKGERKEKTHWSDWVRRLLEAYVQEHSSSSTLHRVRDFFIRQICEERAVERQGGAYPPSRSLLEQVVSDSHGVPPHCVGKGAGLVVLPVCKSSLNSCAVCTEMIVLL